MIFMLAVGHDLRQFLGLTPSRPCVAPTELSEVGSPKSKPDLGEGEYNIEMNTLSASHLRIVPPPFANVKWGRCP